MSSSSNQNRSNGAATAAVAEIDDPYTSSLNLVPRLRHKQHTNERFAQMTCIWEKDRYYVEMFGGKVKRVVDPLRVNLKSAQQSVTEKLRTLLENAWGRVLHPDQVYIFDLNFQKNRVIVNDIIYDGGVTNFGPMLYKDRIARLNEMGLDCDPAIRIIAASNESCYEPGPGRYYIRDLLCSLDNQQDLLVTNHNKYYYCTVAEADLVRTRRLVLKGDRKTMQITDDHVKLLAEVMQKHDLLPPPSQDAIGENAYTKEQLKAALLQGDTYERVQEILKKNAYQTQRYEPVHLVAGNDYRIFGYVKRPPNSQNEVYLEPHEQPKCSFAVPDDMKLLANIRYFKHITVCEMTFNAADYKKKLIKLTLLRQLSYLNQYPPNLLSPTPVTETKSKVANSLSALSNKALIDYLQEQLYFIRFSFTTPDTLPRGLNALDTLRHILVREQYGDLDTDPVQIQAVCSKVLGKRPRPNEPSPPMVALHTAVAAAGGGADAENEDEDDEEGYTSDEDAAGSEDVEMYDRA